MYTKKCEMKVNGGAGAEGGFTASGRDAVVDFLDILHNEYDGKNAEFVVDSVVGNTSEVQWHADGCSGTSKITWGREDGMLGVLKEEFTFYKNPDFNFNCVRMATRQFEDGFNADEFSTATAACYAHDCNVTVNGGAGCEHGVTIVGRPTMSSFLNVLKVQHGGENLQVTVKKVDSESREHEDEFVTEGWSGSRKAVWTIRNGQWKVFDETFTFSLVEPEPEPEPEPTEVVDELSAAGAAVVAVSNPFGAATPEAHPPAANPFGDTSSEQKSASANPFGSAEAETVAGHNPFGAAVAAAEIPFGAGGESAALEAAAIPFGGGKAATAGASAATPFGGGGSSSAGNDSAARTAKELQDQLKNAKEDYLKMAEMREQMTNQQDGVNASNDADMKALSDQLAAALAQINGLSSDLAATNQRSKELAEAHDLQTEAAARQLRAHGGVASELSLLKTQMAARMLEAENERLRNELAMEALKAKLAEQQRGPSSTGDDDWDDGLLEEMKEDIRGFMEGKVEEELVNMRGYVMMALRMKPTAPTPGIELNKMFIRGDLGKEGKLNKSWKKRWFVLDLKAMEIKYYAGRPGPNGGKNQAKGSVLLKDIHSAVHKISKTDKGRRTFSIMTKKRTYRVRADEVATMNMWMTAVNCIATHTSAQSQV